MYTRTNQSCICIDQTLGSEPVHLASCSQRLTHPNISHPAPAAFRGLQLLLSSFKGNVSARSSMKLKDEGEFDGEFLDKNLILFCFLGLIQDELDSTKECWNSHLIRPSSN
ncbi:hypothetical protein SKAU_G00416700 [Synaphobranchus kaupii]|uniref:Uncharacterized protein n=1 Tax=Synaphobranchus kaupii TaxID=118154 RepID=A0A9Q1IAS3_SYNKA|nr:hypothetical protein SKAU_G00416700 [Synaphobranchus kaupii]